MSKKPIKHGTVSGYRYHLCKCEACSAAAYASHRRWAVANKEHLNTYARNKHKNAYYNKKAEALRTLGGACVECGNTDSRVLQIDHINGDGMADRKFRVHAVTMFRAIIQDGHQDKYQLLCANCHMIKTYHSFPPL